MLWEVGWSINGQPPTRLNRKVGRVDGGFTLLETLAALLISGIFLSFSLHLFTGLWRGQLEEKRHLEVQYSVMNSGRFVADAIRCAERVEFSEGVLTVVSWDELHGSLGTDRYYIADKDWDGIKDLYREHYGEPDPVASRISGFACREVAARVWKVELTARWGEEEALWSTLVYRRTDTIE